MAEPKKGGFLSGYAGNPVQRTGRWFVDRILPGNQRASDGTLNNSAVAKGLGLAAGTVGLNMLAPGLGTVVGRAGANYMDTGSIVPLGTGPLAYLMGKGQQQVFDPALANSQQSMQAQILSRNPELAGLIGGSPTASPVTKQQIGFPSNEAGQYTMARPSMNMATMPTVQAETPWTGSLGGANPFGGSYGANLGFGANAPRGYGRAAGSFTPNGAGIVQVAGNGWAGSDAAAGFGLGAQGAGASSAGGYALSDAIALHKKFAR